MPKSLFEMGDLGNTQTTKSYSESQRLTTKRSCLPVSNGQVPSARPLFLVTGERSLLIDHIQCLLVIHGNL